jgi:hypothetical protein
MSSNDDTSSKIFADSDDEEEETKEPSEKKPFTGSLIFKMGKNAGSSLYYVDYTKIRPMSDDERQKLAQDIASGNAELSGLQQDLASNQILTTKLLAEPTNEELVSRLDQEEKDVAGLIEQVQEAKQLMVNAEIRRKLQKKIMSMCGHWRKRKRMTMDFLIGMEEMTDGAIIAKKCLAGLDPLSLESDEEIIKQAKENYFNKKMRVASGRKGLGGNLKMLNANKGGVGGDVGLKSSGLADPAFIGVRLDSQGAVERVYAEDEAKE